MLEHILFERLGGQNCSEIINQTRVMLKLHHYPLSRWYLRMKFWLHFGLHALTLRPGNKLKSCVLYIDSVYNYFTVSCQYFDNKITVLVLHFISIKYFIYHFLNIAKELFLTWFCLAFEQHEKYLFTK